MLRLGYQIVVPPSMFHHPAHSCIKVYLLFTIKACQVSSIVAAAAYLTLPNALISQLFLHPMVPLGE